MVSYTNETLAMLWSQITPSGSEILHLSTKTRKLCCKPSPCQPTSALVTTCFSYSRVILEEKGARGWGGRTNSLATHMHHYQENSPVLLYFIYVEYSTPSQLALAKGDEFQL